MSEKLKVGVKELDKIVKQVGIELIQAGTSFNPRLLRGIIKVAFEKYQQLGVEPDKTAELELEIRVLKQSIGCLADCYDDETQRWCTQYEVCKEPQSIIDRFPKLEELNAKLYITKQQLEKEIAELKLENGMLKSHRIWDAYEILKTHCKNTNCRSCEFRGNEMQCDFRELTKAKQQREEGGG